MVADGALGEAELFAEAARGRPPVRPDGGDDALLYLGELEHRPLDVHLRLERTLLRSQRAQEEDGPRAERRGVAPHRELRLAECGVVPELVLLDDALVRGVGHVL